MNHYLSIILLILLSGTAFGQDTLLLKALSNISPTASFHPKDTTAATKARRDYAIVFTDTLSVLQQSQSGHSGAENFRLLVNKHHAISKDTIYLYTNEYKLTNSEIDSVWHTVFLRPHTQNILKAYLEEKQLTILLPENYINLISVFKSKQITYDTKRHLLVDKIRFDDQNLPKTKNEITLNDRWYPPGVPIPKEENPYLITIPFQSKEQVLADYLEIIEQSQRGNFSEATIIYIRVKTGKKGYYVKRFKAGKGSITYQQSIDDIMQSNITDVALYPPAINKALFSNQGKSGLIIIQYAKQ